VERNFKKKKPKSRAPLTTISPLPLNAAVPFKSKASARDKREDRRKNRLRKVFNKVNKGHNGTISKAELVHVLALAFKKQDITVFGKEILEKIADMQVKDDEINFEDFVGFYLQILNDPNLPLELKKVDQDIG